MTKVREAMTERVLTITPGRTLRDAARFMADHNVGAAVIIDPEQPGPGIITERDLVRAIADGLNPKQAKAGVIMTAEPATVREEEDVSVVALRMMRLGVRHLPVVDAAGRPIGLLSAGDLVTVLDRATS